MKNNLKEYDGKNLKLMEICGTHTSSIFKNGIKSLISPKIHLISGPGCPVCVTPSSYIDRCIAIGSQENHVLLTFGDMMLVPGTAGTLARAKAEGHRIELMYSPIEALEKALKEPDQTFVIAAVGFETTAPIYALVLEKAIKYGLSNLRLLTSIKSMIPALHWICENESAIDGFICPGHVSVIIGSEPYRDLVTRFKRPFVIAGFEGEHLLVAIHDLLRQINADAYDIVNLYPSVVSPKGNSRALEIVNRYFEKGPAFWRGLGSIPGSAYYLRQEYTLFEAGSHGIDLDHEVNPTCRCKDVIIGRISPGDCPLLGKLCTPDSPYGPCMVSAEGACGIWYRFGGE